MKDNPQRNAALASVTLTNAKVILADEVINGTVRVSDGVIAEIDQGPVQARDAIDCDGDYICAGLVELHTDNLERHMQPRPGVKWPLQAAVMAHDAELASVGITTVFDALRVGSITSSAKARYAKYARPVADEILKLQTSGQMRVSHFLHLRAEVCSETVIEELEEFTPADRIGIVSIMDHTPGQRQFRDLAKMSAYVQGKYGMSDQELRDHFAHLYHLRDTYGAVHEAQAAAIGQRFGAVIASHDDTTLADVQNAAKHKAKIAEFPTSIEAAIACKAAGIAVMMGAPNLLRGGSHSGNVAASDLAQQGVLDILSSDYVPASLLMAAVQFGLDYGDLAQGLHRVTAAPAQAVQLTERGEIALGKRADLVRFRLIDQLPSIKGTWREGLRVA
ncbi:alpha-D-ribose 1-methylphosphonate 5-triphosphate diphosphatase [Algirhabdus cladophorae]|uniref:alpha-D-ribose 1-methylphosphonate 5-triphosphate diphosphatase n=1 Tax=Algirhabdus cladophorae TaxID=3377108 RepID=UPI003B846F02